MPKDTGFERLEWECGEKSGGRHVTHKLWNMSKPIRNNASMDRGILSKYNQQNEALKPYNMKEHN